MRRLPILKTIADIIFVLAIIGVFFGAPLLLMLAIMPESVPFKITDTSLTAGRSGAELIIVIILITISYVLWIYALYMFRKVLDLFKKRVIFDERVIKYFDQIGKAIIAGYLIAAAPLFLYDTVNSNPIKINASFGFSSALITLGIGLFFMVLSEVFLIAKGKEETT